MKVHSLTLQRAAELLGGKMKLRELLRVPMSELEAWLAGVAAPPLHAFLKAVDVIDTGKVAIESALDCALRATGTAMGNVQLLYPDGLRIVAQRGFERAFLDFFARVDDAGTACGAAMKQGRRIVVADVASDAIFAGTAAGEVLVAARVRAVQSTPLIGASGRLLGILSTHRDAPGAPEDSELDALDRIARRTTQWLETRS
jgi:GAF domain-containing protein